MVLGIEILRIKLAGFPSLSNGLVRTALIGEGAGQVQSRDRVIGVILQHRLVMGHRLQSAPGAGHQSPQLQVRLDERGIAADGFFQFPVRFRNLAETEQNLREIEVALCDFGIQRQRTPV